MATEEIDDLVSQAPPAKRARFDHNLTRSSSPSTPIDDMDDFYGTESNPATTDAAPQAPTQSPPIVAAIPELSGIPGLGQLGTGPMANVTKEEPQVQSTPTEQPKDMSTSGDANVEMSGMEENIGVSTEKTAGGSFQQSLVSEAKEPPMLEQANIEMSGTVDGVVPVHSALDHQRSAPEDTNIPIAPESRISTPEDDPPLTHALEALLGGLDPPIPKAPELETPPIIEDPAAEENAEWEVDSSPIESSDDSSSDDSSSEEDSEDGENAYKLLSPEEQARILMEGDGGSDDEGGASKVKRAGGQLRTKNEVPEEIIPKPDVTITPEMKIEELGVVETLVDNLILIKAKTSGEYRALETGSVLCLGDRSVIGVVSETLGRVQQPLYTVRFTNAGEITEAGILIGTKIYYPEPHAQYALTQVLKAYKGSDASNLHDEEVGDEEIEFSDDEAEAEHKKRLKQKKLARRGDRMQQNGAPRGGHPLKQQHSPPNGAGGLSYDDADDDGPYKPLARPTGFADTVGRSEAPQEGNYQPGPPHRGGRGDFRDRGRGDRERGRGGDRGRGRGGGYQGGRENHGFSAPTKNRRDDNGYSAPPQDHRNSNTYAAPPQDRQSSYHYEQPSLAQSQVNPLNSNNFFGAPQPQYNQQQAPAWPQFPQFPQFPGMANMPGMQGMPGFPSWPNMPQPPQSGAFINPAFFAAQQGQAQQPPHNQWNQQQHQGPQGGRGRGGPSPGL